MRSTDANIAVAAVATSAAFDLKGGLYAIVVHANSGSGLTGGLQVLSADGSNYVACATARAHVSGYETVYLAAGTYKWVISGSAGGSESFDFAISRVPGE